MRRIALAVVPFLFAVAATGCAGQSRPARMQEAASELNLNARFGRMELASEHVAPEGRPAFFGHRKVWGSSVRIVDSELVGVSFDKDESIAKAMVRVAWQPVDDGDMRLTTIRQTYKDKTTGWFLISEERAEGDTGLFGERAEAPVDAPAPKSRKSKFDTIRLGQGSAPSQEATTEDP